MKIVSTNKKTRHIISYVMPYIHPELDDEFLKYGYFYFNFSERIENQVKQFLDDLKKGEMRVDRYPIDIYGTLLESNIECVENMENPDYEYFKFDSLNHIKSKPIFEKGDNFYKIRGHLLCDLNYFTIDIERIPEGQLLPLIIYRHKFVYSKIMD